MPKKLTTEEFIEKARDAHGDKYDYSDTEYVNTKTKLRIKCKTHGVFAQTPNKHLSGQGCSKCSNKYQPTTEEFIEKARGVHGDKYDYLNANYTSSKSLLKITCRAHGDFEQTPNSHLRGGGCPSCAHETSGLQRRLDTQTFINRSSEIHGDEYDYTLVKYITMNDKVKILCKTHGEFSQSPLSHLSGNGCKQCGRAKQSAKRRLPFKVFKTRSDSVHGGKYCYDKSEYDSINSVVPILCPVHGYFNQRVADHMAGRGCPSCTKRGFDPLKRAWVYVLVSDEGVMKIGISNFIEQRLNQLKDKTPFTFSVMGIYEVNGVAAGKIEKYCHNILEPCDFNGFDGSTEWFKFDPNILSELKCLSEMFPPLIK